jgi:para-nitrobenzyl esterase
MNLQRGEANMTKTKHPMERRTWMKTVGSVIGGTAASVALGTKESVAAPPKAAQTKGTIVASSNNAIVETTAGKIRGFSRDGIFGFKGIPYADDTSGKNRFMAPVKPTPWARVRSAMALGPASPQAINCTFEGRRAGWNNDEEAFMFEWDDGQPGEHCLRVNVWTPSINDNRKRPVLVWIHGGGFTSGSSNELRMYDGESLSRRGDAVVVSLNHRLGALGFMNLMEYGPKWADAVNLGQLDLIAALGWVKDNIGNFGGDAGKVLIFGQSGGGSKVGTLMGMPAAKGLFHRAVIQSGSGLRQQTPDRSGQLAAATLAELGLTKATLDQIQELPYQRIVQAGLLAQRKLQPTPPPPGTGGGLNWGPTVDGKHLPQHAWDPSGPSYSATVPLLVGNVLNEFTNSIQQGDPKLDQMPIEEVKKRLSATYNDRTDAILEVFKKAHPAATPYELLSRINAAGASRQNAVTQAERKAAQGGAPVYMYWFHWQTPILDGRPHAFHCSELPFVFYNTDRCAAMTGGTADARDLGGRIADAWLAFAKNGDPNHSGLPKWAPFTADSCGTMIFDTKSEFKTNPDTEERRALRPQT